MRSINRPIDGQRASISETDIEPVQLWCGLTESVGSGTAFWYGSELAAVYPPVDDEYSAKIGEPPYISTLPAVASIALFVLGDSRTVTEEVGLDLVPYPP